MQFRSKYRLRLALMALLVLSPALTFAQDDVDSRPAATAPEVSASVDRVEAFVGDAITFVITVVADSVTKVAPLNIEKKLGDFEIQDKQLSDAETLKDGKRRYQTTLKLWALKTGEFQIPSVPVYYTNPGASVDSLLTSALTVTVASVVGENVDSASIKPLRDPLEDPLGLKQGFLYSPLFWGIVIALALIAGALVWRYSRKREGEAAWVDPRPAWEIALDRLAGLRNEPLLEQGLFKQYYSELTDTLRDYLGTALETHTLDMTTAELLSTVERGSITAVYKPQIAATLRQADMIKFAKATPPAGRPEEDFETVYSVIVSIRDDLAESRRKEEERQRELAANRSSVEKADSSLERSEARADTSDVGFPVEESVTKKEASDV